MKYLHIQVHVQAVQMKTVVVEARDLDVDVDVDEVDVDEVDVDDVDVDEDEVEVDVDEVDVDEVDVGVVGHQETLVLIQFNTYGNKMSRLPLLIHIPKLLVPLDPYLTIQVHAHFFADFSLMKFGN